MDDRAGEDPALCVSDGSDEGSGQPLRRGDAWEQEQRDTDEKYQTARPSRGGWPTALYVHVTVPESLRYLAIGNCGTRTVADINRSYVATPDWKI
jgi:hypothetical protein